MVVNSTSRNNNGDGITFYAFGSILNNIVEDNIERGIYHVGRSAGGNGSVIISGNEVRRNLMDHSGINHHAAGIEVYTGSSGIHTLYTIVEDNVVEDNYGNGILLYKINHETGVGVINENYKSVVRNNTVSGTKNLVGKTPLGDGILIYKSHFVTVEDNTMFDNDNSGIRITADYRHGVFADSTTNIELNNNEVYNNEFGLLVENGTNTIVVEDNSFSNQEVQIYDVIGQLNLNEVLENNDFDRAVPTGNKIISTIQAAIDAAQDGDTILVGPGVYEENLVINKPLTIIGNSKDDTIINVTSSPNGRDIYINSDNVMIDGFTIFGSSSMLGDDGRAIISVAGLENTSLLNLNVIGTVLSFNTKTGINLLENYA